MNLILAVFMFLGHYIGDFLLQNREIAENKSSSLPHLLIHGFIVGAVMLGMLVIAGLSISSALSIVLIYTALHCVQDKFIWKTFEKKAAANMWKWGEPKFNKWFFRFLGLDQMLHMIVLFALAFLLL
ncbi:MAG: hypothetical protein DRP42_06995 [Tenericutes bacterium]|nr:MAG: hypothetical protein DRP42_06995 [Mycoplasmatota bacterium]